MRELTHPKLVDSGHSHKPFAVDSADGQPGPGHSFARYGLAMELKNSGDFDEITEFRRLLERDEN